ncbi:hypothetical protein KJ797_02370 [Patescibacteria group bacterium]|nr:hypothetical protein [Patescibacteria group bacterium]
MDFDTGKPIPPPGWPLDFDGNPIPPGSPEIPTDFMPENFELYEVQPSDSKENVDATPLQKMIELEVKISSALDGLKSLCDEKPKEKEIISTSCEEACKKYAKCASYAEGATKEDEKDAYDSCMFDTPDVDGAFACPRWSDEAKICVNKKQINTPADCVNFSTICLSKEMQEGRDEVYTEMEKYR